MARIALIQYTARRPEVRDKPRAPGSQAGSEREVHWTTLSRAIERLPQICWDDGSPWREANVWALEMATNARRDLKTVTASMGHILAYAKWLEREQINWWDFPAREADRCLTLFRGALMREIRNDELAPSTASQRMATVVRFYRWMHISLLIRPDWPMWSERQIGIRITDPFGLEHTLRVASTDLAITNRKVAGGIPLEDGVLPVSRAWMHEIIELSEQEASRELTLMLRTGFGSGMRLGSITDLKVETLRGARRHPVSGWWHLSIGPGASPPVATKGGVSGSVPIPGYLLELLIDYLTSTRRLKRVALANEENRGLVFLTKDGNPYGGDESSAVNVAMMRLRQSGRGLEALTDFHFHRTRATFATELMRVALECLPVADAVKLVKDSCLHSDEATTMQYIRFIESSKAMEEAADAFSELFLGLARAAGGSNA